MILKELNLISFGKFTKKRFDLEDGLNIIYGENESGKTTIHNFIDGMFYGFLKPYAKRRNFLEEYEKYRPWNGEQYRGIISFFKEGKLYRIERDFSKGEVKVYDDLTGEDITRYIDTGEKIKIHLPGMYFFDFNNTVYRNTISIKQLGNRIDSSLSKEVKDRLTNISTSLDDDISVRNVLGNLEKQLEDIGTERAYTRPYGMAKSRLSRLQEDRRKSLEIQEEYNKYIEEYFYLKENIEEEKDKINKLQIKLGKAQILGKKRTYEEGLNIQRELERIDKEIERLKKYSNLSFDDYTKGLGLESDRAHLSKEIRGLMDKLNDIEDKLKKIKVGSHEGVIRGIKVEELYKDMSSFEEVEDEKNQLILNSQKTKIGLFNSELKGKLDKGKTSKTLGIILALLTISSLGLGFINPFIFLLAIPLGVATLYVQKSRKESEKGIEDLKLKIQDIKFQEDKRNERIISIENHQKEVLQKYNCLSKSELKRIYEDIRIEHMNENNIVNKIHKLNQEKEQTIVDLENKKIERKELLYIINNIIIKNKSETLEEFKEGLEKKKVYDDLIKDRENKIQILEKTLNNISLEDLKEELSNYDNEYFEDADKLDKVKIIDEMKDREKILSTMKDKNARLEERIDNLNKEVKKLVDIEEETDRLKKLIENYDDRIKAINIAKDTIENISQDIHNQFAPIINRDVSQMIDLVTDGKYTQVKINDNLDVTVENPVTKEIIDIDSLSGGTMDQLYFALRFSIISSIRGENLPLILDDCFIQYDNRRLENMLEYLSKINKEKQILLFTCHHREKEILDNLGLKYNLINLA